MNGSIEHGVLRFQSTATELKELDSREIFVTREVGSLGPISVAIIQISGTAKRDEGESNRLELKREDIDRARCMRADYFVSSSTLTWTNGDTAVKSFVVLIVQDAQAEPEEVNAPLSMRWNTNSPLHFRPLCCSLTILGAEH